LGIQCRASVGRKNSTQTLTVVVSMGCSLG
jgi:hypothetical protein